MSVYVYEEEHTRAAVEVDVAIANEWAAGITIANERAGHPRWRQCRWCGGVVALDSADPLTPP